MMSGEIRWGVPGLQIPRVRNVSVEKPAAPQAPPPQGAPSGLPADAFVPSGDGLAALPSAFLSDYRPVVDGPMDLPDEPAPRLSRPVLFVHGYLGAPEEFRDLDAWLTREGANRSGGILDASNLGEVDPKANVFALRFQESWNSLDTNAAELKAAVEAVCRATGATGVDVVCHSKGGLDARRYLMDPSEKIDRVVTIGTPHKGTFLANLELVFRDRLGYPIRPPIGNPEVRRTLGELTVDRVDRRGRPRNPALHELNAGWDTQRNRADFLVVAGNGLPTLTGLPGVTLLGDSVVPRQSAVRPGAPLKNVWFRTHGSLTRSKAVMAEIGRFLTGKALTPGEDLFDQPGDRERAARMGLLPAPPAGDYLIAGAGGQ